MAVYTQLKDLRFKKDASLLLGVIELVRVLAADLLLACHADNCLLWHSARAPSNVRVLLVEHVPHNIMPSAHKAESPGSWNPQMVHCFTAKEFPNA